MKKPFRFLSLLAVIGCASRASAASPFESFFAPEDHARYRIAAEPVSGGSPSVLDQGVEGSVQVGGDKSRIWSLNGGASLFNLSHPVTLPQTGVFFPESLGSVDGGFGYLHRMGDRRQWGTRISVGSASDHLFHSLSETEVQMTGTWMIPHKAGNAWLFLLNYSNNRSFLNNVPVPGVTYMWNRPDKGFRAVFGFPLVALSYSPTKVWDANLFVLGPTQQGVEIARRITEPVQAYIGYQRNPQQWMHVGRDNNDNRLIYDEKKTVLGLRGEIGKKVTIDLSGGRTFDRRLFEARDATKTGAPRVNLTNGWIINFMLQGKWGN